MKKALLSLFCLLVLFSLAVAQEADSLLLADFEDETVGLGIWSGGMGAGFIESQWTPDPSGLSTGALEVFMDGVSAGFNASNFHIDVDGDTATGLVISVFIPEDFPTDNGVQIFAMDQGVWNWQSTWYTTSTLKLGDWNRLFFDFAERIRTIENYDAAMDAGFQVGVEFLTVVPYYGSVYADNIYLLGVSGSTGVAAKKETRPAAFELAQNYPNPFNPTTTIEYTLPVNETVSVAVYSATGELVQQLVNNQQQSAGVHSLSFDGARLGSGIYFYQVQTTSFSQMKKMLLVK